MKRERNKSERCLQTVIIFSTFLLVDLQLGDDPFNYYVLLINVWANFLYWAFGGSLILMELLAKPKQFFKYKIQPDKSPLKNRVKMGEVKRQKTWWFWTFLKKLIVF